MPAKTLMDAKADVERLLANSWPTAPKPDEVELILWDLPTVQPRVAEISAVWRAPRLSGVSAMQCEPAGLMVCALAERAMLERMYPELGDQDAVDETLVHEFFKN